MIALVTPIKDEINNLNKLVSSIAHQSIVIDYWVIIENDSIDGTKESLDALSKVNNVSNLIIRTINFQDTSYQLGLKYSCVVNAGFDVLKKQVDYCKLKYIGILDADCFPEREYYGKLIKFLDSDNQIGLASGILLLQDGKKGFSNPNHVRGSGRLWKKKCFDEAEYKIGMSADSNSRIKAQLRGWSAKVCREAVFYSREANSRYDLTYGGRSAFYNGFTFAYILTKSILYLFRNIKAGVSYFKGYMSSKIKKNQRNQDEEIIIYNKSALKRKLKEIVRIE